MLKRKSVNSFLIAKFDKCGKDKHDVFPRKVSNTQEKVRGMLKAEFMKWLFPFGIITGLPLMGKPSLKFGHSSV